MAEKNDDPEKVVRLVSPNGMIVVVAESKKDLRLRGGYTVPKSTGAPAAKKKAAAPAASTKKAAAAPPPPAE